MVIFLYNLYILGSIFKLCYIQNCVIMNSVMKRLPGVKHHAIMDLLAEITDLGDLSSSLIY